VVYLDAFSKVLPILLLFALGLFLQRRNFFKPDALEALKKIVLNLTLPSALFLAFSKVNFEARYLLIAVIVFAACWGVLLIGRAVQSATRLKSPYFPALLTGFEAGMLGYALYSSVYGADNLYKFGVIDLGQVVFVFFVLVNWLRRRESQAQPIAAMVRGFLTTPPITAILLGIAANALGVTALLNSGSIGQSVLKTLEMLAALTSPLIALLIGYEMRLEFGQLGAPLRTVLIRLAIWIPLGVLFSVVVIDRLLGLDRGFQVAVLTMVVLPPPFVIPLYMQRADQDDRAYVVNTLSLSTLVTLFAFAIVSVLFA
jgi:malate permease and related proteins